VQLNDKEQLVTRVEVAESKELFTSINSFLKLCLYLHQQAADRKIIEVYRKQYAAIMKTPEDSEIMPAFRDTIAAELQSQQES
jgi:hypothetical protein